MRKLYKYTAPWCASCKTLGTTIDQLKGEFPDVAVIEIDISQIPTPGITTLPTLRLDGKELKGNVSASKLREFLRC